MNFFESLNYCITCQRVFGISLITIDKTTVKLNWTSRLLPSVWSCLYLCCLFYFFTVESGATYFGTDFNMFVVIANLELFVTIFTYSVVLVATQFKQFQELEFYQSLYEFDQQMIVKFQVDFRYLDYKRRSRLAILAAMGYFGLILLMIGINIGANESDRQISFYAASFMQSSSLFVLTLSYCNVMLLLKTRYEILDKCVLDYGHTVWKFEDLIKMRRQLNRSIEQINSVYGFKQLINLLNEFLVMTIELYAFFAMLRKQDNVSYDERSSVSLLVTWLSLTISKVLLTCCCAQIVMNKIKSTSKTIQDMRNVSEPSLEVMDMYSLSVVQDEFNFNACEFFKIDMTLVYGFVGAISTYFVVLLQFE